MNQQDFFKRYQYSVSTDKLGGGAFGKVYKAYDTVLDKYVALKVAEQIQSGSKVFSLLDEFKALEKLNDHPNIAKYEQLFTFESPQGIFDYAIMQYYSDGNFSQLIRNKSLNAIEKEALALQLLNGIEYLHENNVVHRDLKPSNILVHNRVLNGKKEYILKITDFGLSKKAGKEDQTKFTNSFAAGTYAYSSPEQLKGEVLRFNTDLWAYGVIVYELFTGKLLFQVDMKNTGSSALDIQDILSLILKGDTSHKIAELPDKWQPAISACLVRDASKRVKSAKEIRLLLETSVNKKEILETPSTVIEPKPITTPKETSLAVEETVLLETPKKPTLTQDNVKPKHTNKYILLALLIGAIVLTMVWSLSKKKDTKEPLTIESRYPVDVALAFINAYINSDIVDYTQYVKADSLTTEEFKKQYVKIVNNGFKEDPEIGLGFDPILNAQDAPASFVLESYDSTANFIIVKGSDDPQHKLAIKIIKEGNKWMVDGCGIINIPENKRPQDITAITNPEKVEEPLPTSTEIPEWKTYFDKQFASLKNKEYNKTNQTNIIDYKTLLNKLPSEASEERNKVKQRITYFENELEREKIKQQEALEAQRQQDLLVQQQNEKQLKAAYDEVVETSINVIRSYNKQTGSYKYTLSVGCAKCKEMNSCKNSIITDLENAAKKYPKGTSHQSILNCLKY